MRLNVFEVIFLAVLAITTVVVLFLTRGHFTVPIMYILLLTNCRGIQGSGRFLHALAPRLSKFLVGRCALVTLPFTKVRVVGKRFASTVNL